MSGFRGTKSALIRKDRQTNGNSCVIIFPLYNQYCFPYQKKSINFTMLNPNHIRVKYFLAVLRKGGGIIHMLAI